MSAIDVVGVTKSYGKNKVINNLSFSVEKGENFGLLGPNGTGKSTLINMMTGTLFPDEGEVVVLGKETKHKIEDIRNEIALVPQTISLYESLTVYENLDFFGNLYLKGQVKTKVEEILHALHLGKKRSSLVSILSGGYQRLTSIACALMAEPEILFLDEPLAGIDIYTHNLIVDFLKSKEDMTIIFTTHSVHEAEMVCDRILFLGPGKKLLEGKPEEIINQYSRLFGEKIIIEFDSLVNVGKVRSYFENAGFNIKDPLTRDNTFSFTCMDLGKTVVEVMSVLHVCQEHVVNIDIKKISLEDILKYVVLENEKTTGNN